MLEDFTKRRNHMNNEEAKLILRAYRPGGQDASDPVFSEALEQARRDPELARWFAHEQAMDSRISAKVRSTIEPPDNLKAQLLAQSKIVRPEFNRRRRNWVYAIAAALALLISLSLVWLRTSGGSFTQYRSEMAQFAGLHLDRLDLMTRDVAEIRHWLSQKDSHEGLVLPAGLDGKPSLGCRLLEWKGRKVSLICFELENRQVGHLLVIDGGAFNDAPGDAPQFQQVGEVATASWSRGGKTYVVASKGASQLDLLKLL